MCLLGIQNFKIIVKEKEHLTGLRNGELLEHSFLYLTSSLFLNDKDYTEKENV